jgi:anti-sigma-K factor RskA
MNEKEQAILYDLLTKKALYGLDEAEQGQLDQLDPGNADMEFRSLEMTAAAIALANIEIEPMPVHLRARLDEGADKHFAEAKTIVGELWPPATRTLYEPTEETPRFNWFGWLGWAAAAAAVIALAINIYISRPTKAPEIAHDQPQHAPQTLTTTQMRDDFVKTAADIVRASWAAGNVKGITQLVGDVVWSDEKQSGYMTFKGLPPNPPDQYTYQLWIKAKNQEDMIDGGTFDVNSQGEVVIPIDAKLKAKSPDMFAVTMEKPGGVVVSKKEKIVSIAKVETHREPNT